MSGSPKFGRLKYSQPESRPSTPIKTVLVNGEPERQEENGDQKPEDNFTPPVFGK